MAQSDQVVQNNTFPVVRADINDNLEALYSQSSGVSAPTVTVAFQPWVDTSVSPPLWKVRNAANTGWITVGVLDANFQVAGIAPIANGGTGQTTAAAAINALVPSQTGNAGKFLGTNGSALSWLTAAGGASVQVFSSSGTFTPTANKVSFLVFAVGGGGGSGAVYNGRSGGGGSGGCGWRIYNNTELGADAVVTVGGGGAAGSGGFFPTNGGTGGTSSFDPAGTGLTVSGTGGSGSVGAKSSATDGGNGGGSANGLISWSGNPGFRGDSGQQQVNRGMGGYPAFWGAGRGAEGRYNSGIENGNAGSGGAVVILEF